MKILIYESFKNWLEFKGKIGRVNRTKILESFESDLNELRVGHHQSHIKDVNRSSAAKRAWKLHRGSMKAGIERYHDSPTGRRFHRDLARFNQEGRGKAEDYNLIAPLFTISLAEHISWLIHQDNFKLYEEVYELMDTLTLAIEDPDILKDVITMNPTPINIHDGSIIEIDNTSADGEVTVVTGENPVLDDNKKDLREYPRKAEN